MFAFQSSSCPMLVLSVQHMNLLRSTISARRSCLWQLWFPDHCQLAAQSCSQQQWAYLGITATHCDGKSRPWPLCVRVCNFLGLNLACEKSSKFDLANKYILKHGWVVEPVHLSASVELNLTKKAEKQLMFCLYAKTGMLILCFITQADGNVTCQNSDGNPLAALLASMCAQRTCGAAWPQFGTKSCAGLSTARNNWGCLNCYSI